MSNERPMNPGSSTLTEGLKRKRGRPKKQPQEGAVGPLPVKKPRGRPKGSKKMTTVSGQMVEPSAGKRPRGRPRKWVSTGFSPFLLLQSQILGDFQLCLLFSGSSSAMTFFQLNWPGNLAHQGSSGCLSSHPQIQFLKNSESPRVLLYVAKDLVVFHSTFPGLECQTRDSILSCTEGLSSQRS
ncbi:uncharacterized protein LOC115614290 isoform X1 [Strigops habroptila]|uniref:uncharacterized protein LOC115614290 isoform X1 n=1 Tax=Strigops habroptila TaxID=2489341 RepID=UPI0011CF6C2B|nr:uncharacterized protein LOC115614290 isoform X1 [Strigops habroptila]XP_030356807.1 uncharacterized protein LOC115614290 isoform X1 [Strigops habroptila]XP_030356808.1 uncharacterized protein LOC115614290 isoform X1 [Strigops habroptila]XP_030356809.1 uncharacterized protein LOC115614290 isoform X1 [Strigops habroptila]